VDEIYSVSVIGFNRTEQIVLNSIFALSARRSPKFVPLAPGASNPSVFLVDASSDEYINYLALKNADRAVPAILVGDNDHGTQWPVLERPLQWARLFKAFDHAMESIAKQAKTATTAAPAAVSNDADSRGYSLRDFERPSGAPTSTPAIVPAAVPAALPTTARPAPATPAVHVTDEVTQRLTAMERTIAQPQIVNEADWVLVVDDNMTVREFMAGKLAPFQFNVEFAESGEKALFMCSQRHYTCVFLDVVMPGMDGYQVCKHVKGRRTVRKTNVVMLTSRSSPFDKIRGTMAGCDAYLTKPVDEEKLLGVIAKFLNTGGDLSMQPA
jgi:two-component system, cell cycle response regulator